MHAALDFRADTYRCRVYSGADALASLPAELKRLGARRALVVCGQSVGRSELIGRLRSILGDSWAGVFDQAGRHAEEAAVLATVAAMRETRADILLAVGAGSIAMHARIAAILHAEERPVEEIVTRYPEHGPAVSPRLAAPKLPIINILTCANNAQNRAGSAMRRPGVARRMEMFDPKTRPASIYWDSGALATAPASMWRTGGFNILWWSLMNLGSVDSVNPLSQADRWQSFRLAAQAWPKLLDGGDDASRIGMCAAAFLQNRDEDDGSSFHRMHWPARVCYALGSGIFSQRDDVETGAVYAALTVAAITVFGERNLHEMRRMVEAAGGIGAQGTAATAGPNLLAGGSVSQASIAQLAQAMQAFLQSAGQTARLRDLGVARQDLPAIRDFALRNWNADREREFQKEQHRLDAVLDQAW